MSDKIVVFPSRMCVAVGSPIIGRACPLTKPVVRRAQTQMKLRLKAAQKGHSLLKKKGDALMLRFRSILRDIVSVRCVCYAWL